MATSVIRVYALGGTIAALGSDSQPVLPKLSARQLLDDLPGSRDGEVDVVDFRQVASPELKFKDAVDLVARMKQDAAGSVRAFVVTQGTDTLEEFAFAIDSLWDGPQPVVCTGAMRPARALGRDGPRNLADALLVAGDQRAAGRGCLVVLNEQIHAARNIRKVHPARVDAFESTGTGPIGHICEGKVSYWARSVRPPGVAMPGSDAVEPRVALVRISMGDDGGMLELVASGDYHGAVVETLGAGHVPSACLGPLRRLSAVMPVVLVSRVGPGQLFEKTYGYPGSEVDLRALDVNYAGHLDGAKARVKLALLLMAGATAKEIAEAFANESFGQGARQRSEVLS